MESFCLMNREQILLALSLATGYSKEALIGKEKGHPLGLYRHFCSYLLKYELEMPFTHIGKLLNRHHTSIMYSVRRADDLIETERQFQLFYADLKDKFHDLQTAITQA